MIGILLLIIWLLIAVYGIIKSNYVSINILIFMCIFQNFILIAIAKYINKNIFILFIFIKEIYVLIICVYRILQKGRITKFQLGNIICIILLIFYGFIYGSDSITGMLSSVRQMYLPFVFFLLGSVCYKEPKELLSTLQFFIKIMIVTAIFGWIEMALGTDFWTELGYSSFATLKGTESGLSPEGVHGAFFSWDLGRRVRRMASFIAEPVILGQLFAFALIISIFIKNIVKNKIQKYIIIIILALALLSTIAKGGIIIALFAFTFALGEEWNKRSLTLLSRSIFFIILSIGIAYVLWSDTNGITHMAGLFENLRFFPFYPFGRGIGTIGNLGYNYGGRSELIANGESFIGAIIGQAGIVAIIIYTYFYYGIIKFFNHALIENWLRIRRICLWLNVGLLLTALVNNTAISFTSCFIYFILAGGIYGSYQTEAYKIEIGNCETH